MFFICGSTGSFRSSVGSEQGTRYITLVLFCVSAFGGGLRIKMPRVLHLRQSAPRAGRFVSHHPPPCLQSHTVCPSMRILLHFMFCFCNSRFLRARLVDCCAHVPVGFDVPKSWCCLFCAACVCQHALCLSGRFLSSFVLFFLLHPSLDICLCFLKKIAVVFSPSGSSFGFAFIQYSVVPSSCLPFGVNIFLTFYVSLLPRSPHYPCLLLL